jgi:DNA segregation ATPase FtsK/SpoIIIE, S-DNA-T family
MVKKRRSRRSRNQLNNLEQFLGLLLRPEAAGLLLVFVSLFTLLSLLTGSRGQITGAWVDTLSSFVGMGVWGLPLVAGILGLWIMIRAIERMPDLPWQRPVGIFLLFLAYITAVSIIYETQLAGGWLGMQLAQLLVVNLGTWAAWFIVSFTVMVGFIFLTDRLMADAAQSLWLRIQEWRDDWDDWRNLPPLEPTLPMPSGELPWWKRLVERFNSEEPPVVSPPNLVRPHPGPPSSVKPSTTPSQGIHLPRPQGTAATQAGGSKQPEGELLTPRIVGAAQEWRLPRVGDVLNDWERSADSDDLIRRQGRLIQETLALFGVPADFEGAYKGPSVTQYLIKPGYVERSIKGESKRVKVKVSKIASLSNDLALALAASSVRIEAPIPGTNYVGVEVPNQESNVVGLKELMESEAFQQMKAKLRIALGEDVKGQPIVSDLTRMPHMLIAGATGSGKSVCINSIISCLLLTHTPDNLRFLMIDPKMVELSVYNGVPHLLSPVVTEVDRASGVLFWAVKEMERRYQLCSKVGARDLVRYNDFLVKRNEKPLPYIVVIVDEMADLMMAAPEEVEKHICRLAQMARAVGIHLIIATQRPSVDVITGLIKANFPARIAFAVTSQIDSRVILDVPGAERLLGKGDMLFMSSDSSKLERIQGTFLHDDEINRVVRYWKGIRVLAPPQEQQLTGLPEPTTAPSPLAVEEGQEQPASTASFPEGMLDQSALFAEINQMKVDKDRDELFNAAVKIVQEAGRGSVSLLQRKLRIGYNRSSRLVDQLETAGILGPDMGGSHGRQVLVRDPDQPDNQPMPPVPPAPRIIGEADDNDDAPGRARVWM